MLDTRENCWKFFIDRVRRQLKVVLCFSPVGSVLRVRSRKFPALVNCTSINWFHEWPQQALMSVSNQFLSELEVLPVNDFFNFSTKIVLIYHCQWLICGVPAFAWTFYRKTSENLSQSSWVTLTRKLTSYREYIYRATVGTITPRPNRFWNRYRSTLNC